MSRFRFLRSMLVSGGAGVLLLAGATSLRAQQYDQPDAASQPYSDTAQTPGRVARLAWLSGQVQFAPAGENDWGTVEINRPMVLGDRLLTGNDGRAVLELGDASVRIDHDSAFDFLNLAQGNVQIELSQGTLNLAVRQLDPGANFEVDTPTVAFVAATPGIYRIDDDPDGTGSMVTVFQGSGTVYGENGASREVVAGTSYRFNDSTLASVYENDLPQPDDFDRFCETRDSNYRNYARQEQQYVPSDMIGGDDLYQYGEWNAVPQYGNVWYPTSVPAGWAPYRYGRWAWIDPWGWTWVDNEPWGFAPFHYGRWVYVSNRWGWMPGPIDLRPVYAPALVGFIGGSGFSLSLDIGGGGPVGWFPLGPRDVYMPWFHASRRYFTNVNVTNIRNVYVNRTVINNFYGDYRRGRVPPRGGHDYAYRRMPGAVTAVPRNVFTDARPVHAALVRLNRTQLARTEVALRPGVNPDRASLGLRGPAPRPAIRPGREPFARPVVARHQPPPRPLEFAAREKIIASQHGQPLTPTQLRALRRDRTAIEPSARRVKLIPALAGGAAGAAAIEAMRSRNTPPRPTEAPARRVAPTEPPFKNTVHPIPARVQPERPALRPGELPSARFAHPDQPRMLPRPALIRPADESQPQRVAPGRLPAVRPLEHAPQSMGERIDPRQRQADLAAQQPLGEQQVQQQRQWQEAARQRLRAQSLDQQRAAREQQLQRQAQMQQQQRAREQQVQRQMQEQPQRQSWMQTRQFAREQQMQQQMQAQPQRPAQFQERARAQPMRAPEMRQAPQPRNNRATVQREPPPRKQPPESGGRPIR
jgi:hypothetical protein